MEADEPEAAHVRTQELVLDVDDVNLPASVAVPNRARGLVIFALGSGSSRSSPRNLEVARALQRAGIAPLLLDLLTEPEAADIRARFDVPLLARRLVATARWAGKERSPARAARILRRERGCGGGVDRRRPGACPWSPPWCRAAGGPILRIAGSRA